MQRLLFSLLVFSLNAAKVIAPFPNPPGLPFTNVVDGGDVSSDEQLKLNGFPQCGNCYCIPGPTGVCPTPDPPPPNSLPISMKFIQRLKEQIPENPFSLNCNPYKDNGCETSPPQSMTELKETAVCGILYNATDNCDTYKLVTYDSQQKALDAGAVITHAGACGVCSTTQDLAAYILNNNLESAASKCAAEAVAISEQAGLLCYEELGLTYDCAKMWVYNSINTDEYCIRPCLLVKLLHLPNNGPPPECMLNKCLNCDEVSSGPLFQKVAGRSRRRSGLLSEIIRPCDSIYPIAQRTTCPFMPEGASPS